MLSVLARDAMAETFSDLRGVIEGLAVKTALKYRMDIDEMKSLAYEGFVEAFGTFDPKKGTFRTHACQKVWSKLQEYHRTFMRRIVLTKQKEYDLSLIQDNLDDSWFIDFLDSLSDDAKIVAKLTIDSPKDIIHVIVTKGDSPAIRRSAIREYLKDIGWTAARIAESINEIGDALR